MTNQTFNLDLIPQGVPPIVRVSQYDKGQTWNIHLFENGVVFPVPSGTSAAVQGTKPDNTGFQYPAVISIGDNVVTFTVEQQMTVLGGQFECELVLVNGEDQVATINFILEVEPTTLDDDTVISETELPLIEQAAELGTVINGYATQIHADAETATAAATSASADAATATAAADDATASQTAAASSASNAATSETNAAASATAAASSASSAAQEATNAAASAAAAQAAIATDMTGATSSTAGVHGLVPAPAAGDNTKFLGGDGTWKDVPAELSGLTDVSLGTLANGDVLNYNSTSQKWENAALGTAASKDSTNAVTQNSTDLVESGAVYSAVNAVEQKLSHVGMIIHSTTLDTEAKVKAIYGGTTWVKIEGKFLLGTSSSHAINTTGGSETVTLTTAQIPSHAHSIFGSAGAAVFKGKSGSNDAAQASGSRSYANLFNTDSNGGGQAHNNMPPYKTVYIWERTA